MDNEKKIKWVFDINNICEVTHLDTVESVINKKKEYIAKFDHKIAAFIKIQSMSPEDKKDQYYWPQFWPFDQYIQKMFHTHEQLEIQLKYIKRKEQKQQITKQLLLKIQNSSKELQERTFAAQIEGAFNQTRMFKKKTSADQCQYRKSLHVILLAANPLVKVAKVSNTIQPLFGLQTNMELQYKLLEDAQVKNYCISLSAFKHCFSQQKTRNLVKQCRQQMCDLRVIQVYTSFLREGGKNYLTVQYDRQIGRRGRMEVLQFFKEIDRISNVHLVILIGKGFRQFDQNLVQFERPYSILCISTFSMDTDQFAKKFLSQFYKGVFTRKKLQNCFDSALKKVQPTKEKDLKLQPFLFNCCCLHKHQSKSRFHLIEKIAGKYIHKMLFHLNATYLKKDRIFLKEFVNFICEQRNEEEIEHVFECYQEDNKHKDSKIRDDYKLFLPTDNQDQVGFDEILSYPPSEKADIAMINEFPKNKFPKNYLEMEMERPHVVFSLIRKILIPGQTVINIVGGGRSGKFLFVHLAKNYLEQRMSSFQFHLRFSDEFKENKQNHDDLLHVTKQYIRPKSDPTTNVLFVGKISIEDYQAFSRYIRDLNIILDDKRGKLKIIVNSYSEITDLNPSCFFELPQPTREQILYVTIRELNQKYLMERELVKLQNDRIQAIKSIMNDKIYQKMPYLDYAKFINDFNPINKNIKSVLSQFKERPQKKLQLIKQENPHFWELLNFISNFPEGLLFCKFNEGILKVIFPQISEIKTKLMNEGKQNQGINFTEIESLSTKKFEFDWGKLIRPTIFAKSYFKEEKNNVMWEKKLRYFQYFFKKLFLLSFELRKQIPSYRKFLFRQGIFMLLNNNRKRQKFDEEIDTESFSLTSKGKRNLLNHLLNYNAKSFTSFLKDIQSVELYEQNILKILDTIFQALLINKIFPFNLHNNQQSRKVLFQFIQKTQKKANQVLKDEGSKLNFIIYELQIKRIFHYDFFNEYHPSIDLLKSKEKIEQNPILFIIKNLISFENDYYTIRKLKSSLISEPSHTSREEKKQREDIIDTIGNIASRTIENMDNTIKTLESINNIQSLGDRIKQKLIEIKIFVVIYKIVIRFQQKIQTSTDHRFRYYTHEKLEQELNKFRNQNKQNSYINEIKICAAYLDLQRGKTIKTDQFNFKESEILPMVMQLYKEVWETFNPRQRLKKDNIALFMRSRCLIADDKICAYVRKKILIRQFLMKALQKKQMNLFFLNLSCKNFNMVSEAYPENICFFVLTVDTVLKNDKHMIIFQQEKGQSQQIELSQFLKMISNVHFKFLIVVGSLSSVLCSKIIQNARRKNKFPCTISFQTKRTHTLSNYPYIQSSNLQQVSSEQIINNYLNLQNEQRVTEMTICLIISFLASQKIQQVSNLRQKVDNFFNQSKKIVEKWYQDKKMDKIGQQITIKVMCDIQKLQWSKIPIGQIKDLSEKINRIDKNLKDQTHYEMVGRVNQLRKIIDTLTKNRKKKCMVEISGNKNSGRTQLLKQLGWFCHSRHLFGLGIYYIDFEDVRKENQQNIFDYLQLKKKQQILNLKLSIPFKEEENPTFLLLLLDNLTATDIVEHNQFFKTLSRGSSSVVYTTTCKNLKDHFISNGVFFDDLQSSESDAHYHIPVQHKKIVSSVEQFKWFWKSYELEKLNKIDRVVISLLYLRQRKNPKIYNKYIGKLQKEDDLDSMFQDISQNKTTVEKFETMQHLMKELQTIKRQIRGDLTKQYLPYDLNKLLEKKGQWQEKKTIIKIKW